MGVASLRQPSLRLRLASRDILASAAGDNSLLDQARILFGFLPGLRSYLRDPFTYERAMRLHARQLRERGDSFLGVMRRAVYGHASSPYLALLRWARVEYGDVERLVRERDVEGALAAMHAAGVYVSLEEFKGRAAIQRPGLEVSCRAEDFDNPLAAGPIRGQTSGSRGAARRGWHPRALIHAKFGRPVVRWFSQSPTRWPAAPFPSATLTALTAWGGARWSTGFALPEHLPLDQAGVVAGWLAEQKRSGRKVQLATGVSSAVRVCQSASDLGLDISGTFFDLGGEAFTPSRAALIRQAGCRAGCFYSVTEAGQIGCPCSDPRAPDDVHVLRAKVAVTQNSDARRPDALWFTTLRASPPKILLNVESGDTGVLETRACGCSAGSAGLDLHVHTVRSYEKLTSEGMHFLGSDLLRLVEEVLPAAFGGGPTDYQFVERYRGGLPEVCVVVHPRMGAVEEARVVAVVLEFLGARSRGERMMSDIWKQGRTLQVLRREPFATGSAKIPVLHVVAEE